MNKYSRLFKVIRMELNLTQKELARRLAIGTGSIYKYENELMMPGTKVLEKIKNLCSEETLTEPLKILSNFNIDTKKKENIAMDAEYLISLQRDKIEYQEERILKLKTALENKQAESTHWEALEFDFVCHVTLFRHGLGLGRTIDSVTDINYQAKVLGYTKQEMDRFWDIGVKHTKINKHPIEKIIDEETSKNIQKQATTLPLLFDSLKSIVGDHYIPQPVIYIHKEGHKVPAMSYNKISWRNLQVTSKLKFLVNALSE